MTGLPLNEQVNGLIKEYGMTLLLRSLIVNCAGKERYLVDLQHDLQHTLDRYERRYRWEALGDE